MWDGETERELCDLALPLLELCGEAGEVIEGHYRAPGADCFESKGDDSPLTRADLDSHRILRAGLTRIAPAIPVLSEESPEVELRGRLDWPLLWLVDPLDGTKEFLARTGEFTINIALVRREKPVLGLVYEPLARLGFLGIPGQGAWRYEPDEGAWRRSALHTRPLRADRPLCLLASRRHRGPRLQSTVDWLRQQGWALERLDSGSALKFCQLAGGGGDFYPRYSPCSEWDVAAGQALLEASGGAVVGLDGAPLRYNRRETLLSPNFLALADPGHELWRRLLARSTG